LRGGWRPLSLRTPLLLWEGTKSPLIPLYERGTIMVGLKLRDKQRMRLGGRVGKDNKEFNLPHPLTPSPDEVSQWREK